MDQIKLLTPEIHTQPSFENDKQANEATTTPANVSPLLIKRPILCYTAFTLLWLAISLIIGTLLAWVFADEWQKTALPKTQEPLLAVIKPKPNPLDLCETTIRNLLKAEKIHFATASAVISTKGRKTLDKVIIELRKCDNAVLTIEGHTDNTGSAQFNKKLSLERANSVATEISSANLKGFTLITQGLGSSEPIASNKTEKGRYENRRIEFYLSKKQSEPKP